VYRPVGDGPFPAVVEVHGGAWDGGTRLSDATLNEHLASSGVVVVAIEFRRPPEGAFPGSVQDVNAAVRWVRSNSGPLHLAGPIGALGNSSGGHQVMLSALLPEDPAYNVPSPQAPGISAYLDFVVLCWPVIDPLTRYTWALEQGLTRLTDKHDSFWRTTENMRVGSPQHIVAGGHHTHLPPVLMIHGDHDENLPPGMIDRFDRTYRQAGGDITTLTFPGQSHNFAIRDPLHPDSVQAVAAITDFIRQHTPHDNH
jgi:acetyl esterase